MGAVSPLRSLLSLAFMVLVVCAFTGNNEITSLDNLMYLRQFKGLDVANLDGNPVCTEPDYRSMVYAFMPWLKYLDYILIDEQKRVEARETHQVFFFVL